MSTALLASLLLASQLLALALPAGAERDTHPRRALAAPWTLEADRLIGRLPMSVSVRERGRLVYAHAGNLPRTPASNEKLLLSMALLAHFGPAYRIPTTIEGLRPTHGIIGGDLWLVGHGDPELNDAALQRLARTLRARGTRAVRGSVIGATNTFSRANAGHPAGDRSHSNSSRSRPRSHSTPTADLAGSSSTRRDTLLLHSPPTCARSASASAGQPRPVPGQRTRAS